MSEVSGGATKLELAKEAAARSVELLFPSDRVGVIAFDDAASWVVPMSDLYDLQAVVSAIGGIQVGGGTDILAGLQAMAQVLPDDPARVKHVILLTDGGANPAGIPELVTELYERHGITLSSVAVGHDAAPFLEGLAVLGGGRYHFTADPGSIPSIFTEETTLATRAYLIEEPFFPELVSPSPVLAGIASTPRLYGYVATSPKDLAQVVLQSEKGDPLLAVWQYGLGRALAFTSDASGRWAKDWVGWSGFPAFWAGAVRETIGEDSQAALQATISLEAGAARLTLDAFDRSGEFLNGYRIDANVVSPDGETQSLQLRQVAPGRYEATFRPEAQGGYLIGLSGKPPEGVGGEGFAETTGWTLAYSPEYLRLDPDPDLLLHLATVTGGSLASANPADAFTHDLRAQRSSRPIWPWLLTLAALLLPFDVAARRLILTRQDLVRLRTWLAERVRPTARLAPSQEPRSQRMQSLLSAKGRVRRVPDRPATFVPPPAALPEEARIEAVRAAEEEPPGKRAPDDTPPAASTAAALLARKKSVREKRDLE
jgi:Ca-activated chloride channel family protein